MGDSNENTGGGITQSITSTVSDAYNKAPDLGVTSTLQAAYDKTPSMAAVQQTAADKLGLSKDSSAADGQGQGQDSAGQGSDASKDGEATHGGDADGDGEQGPSLADISKERGPSTKDRLDKPQQSLGTEYGIPTTAGAGATVSPDATNQDAAKVEKDKGKQNKAAVPEDYAPQPCPVDNAGTGKVDDIQKQAAGNAARGTNSRLTDGASQSGQEQSSSSDAHAAEGNGTKDRDAVDKIKDSLKGNMKVLKGRVTRKEEKVDEGKAIKHGDA